ncbi:hypothetical protein EVAR_59931_1 [Eumeta japonica]|uniref:Uncharacterized protein n=1 Tax=Eumeta variegata TaxID=151549 RepID=A0A4C1YPE7_EUMVA|nr:hypothetical protein EVAR_59931_1 [Eumeta japonica]
MRQDLSTTQLRGILSHNLFISDRGTRINNPSAQPGAGRPLLATVVTDGVTTTGMRAAQGSNPTPSGPMSTLSSSAPPTHCVYNHTRVTDAQVTDSHSYRPVCGCSSLHVPRPTAGPLGAPHSETARRRSR